MKPAARRRVEREIRQIMQKDGERCSMCKAPLEHNSRTFGGTTKTGASVLTGECCKAKIATVILSGLYMDARMDDLVRHFPTGDGRSGSAPTDVEKAVAAIHNIFADRQAEGAEVARRAGFPAGKAKLFTQTTAWKSDDAAWFENHPTRSHRLRPLIGDEAEVSGFTHSTLMPLRHEMQILVRQVEPGKRMRLSFGRNLDVPIPDDEEVLHALFDLVSEGGEGSVISAEAMRAALARFGSGDPGLPS
ncbi:hypothetical protein [Sphingomonas sp. NIBR02145]|uniref:hypothetical protein n=1 Tax=Sphingomonas sp. NIBR02145 TaxID=3014784 RepID=UPI0022B3FDF2|nr:hypothetical protein [Sphingomonas sp. NIBR02145]WHU03665.1 hypothetical protein O3305_03415 [Sphingomonas sp. NIBR02145]